MKAHTREQRLWVVFTDQTDLWWLKILPKGFRHCFVLIHDGRNWITVDPLSSRMEIVVQDVPQDFDLPAWLKSEGHIVLRARKMEREAKPAPMMPFSCVETVKRILGIHARGVITPWQLYQHLQCRKSGEFFQKNRSTLCQM